MNNSKDLQIK
jgi:hypothetical protein